MARGKAHKGAKRLNIERSRHIRVPLDVLKKACIEKLSDEKDKLRFIDFVRR